MSPSSPTSRESPPLIDPQRSPDGLFHTVSFTHPILPGELQSFYRALHGGDKWRSAQFAGEDYYRFLTSSNFLRKVFAEYIDTYRKHGHFSLEQLDELNQLRIEGKICPTLGPIC
jgi:hypothetical protein